MKLEPIRVLVIDDSAVSRSILKTVIDDDPALTVVGTAPDAFVARDKIKRLNPQVLTLDVEMPGMDGITFLKNLMRLHPMPVIMVSSLTTKGADTTFEALALGAIDYVTKPDASDGDSLDLFAARLREKLHLAARANLIGSRRSGRDHGSRQAPLGRSSTRRIIAIGASAGGTEAIRDVLVQLPPDAPPVVICQHMPATFTGSFAARLNREAALSVTEAEDGADLIRGHAYVAPGHSHLLVVRQGGGLRCRLDAGATVNRHRPAVDVLFQSLTALHGPHVVAALLTGMGHDGAAGLLALRRSGAATLCQDEATSLVWGMPGEAVRLGAAEQVLPLHRIASGILGCLD